LTSFHGRPENWSTFNTDQNCAPIAFAAAVLNDSGISTGIGNVYRWPTLCDASAHYSASTLLKFLSPFNSDFNSGLGVTNSYNLGYTAKLPLAPFNNGDVIRLQRINAQTGAIQNELYAIYDAYPGATGADLAKNNFILVNPGCTVQYVSLNKLKAWGVTTYTIFRFDKYIPL
jgi:hypothetical protein